MNYFRNEPFTYDRRCPPLYLAEDNITSQEKAARHKRMKHASREYFRLALRDDTDYQTPMPSLGCQLGEYAMYLIVQRNVTRRTP